MTMSRCYMLKLGILIVVTMLFPFGALAEENGEPQDIRRHCIGLLWCTERSVDARLSMACYGSIRLKSEAAILG